MNNTPESTRPPASGWLFSLAFWLCLLAAAGMYASVALAPKLLTYVGLRNEYRENQVRLVGLEGEVGNLQKVADALENEPAFAAEMLRIDFDASRPGDERIAVDGRLVLAGAGRLSAPAPTAPATGWIQPLLDVFAGHTRLRTAILWAAALLTIFSFTFLPDSQRQPRVAEQGSICAGWHWLGERYRR